MYKIFAKPACLFCLKTKNLLDRKGLEYEYVDISQDENAYDFIVNYSGFRTLPQIYCEGDYVGGFEELTKHLS